MNDLERNKLTSKLNQLKDLYDFQVEIGEDTKAVSMKIRELEKILK